MPHRYDDGDDLHMLRNTKKAMNVLLEKFCQTQASLLWKSMKTTALTTPAIAVGAASASRRVVVVSLIGVDVVMDVEDWSRASSSTTCSSRSPGRS